MTENKGINIMKREIGPVNKKKKKGTETERKRKGTCRYGNYAVAAFLLSP